MADQKKLKAIAKVVGGAAQVVSGVLTATGHGLIGGYLRNHQMMAQASILGRKSVESGTKRFKEGLKEMDQ